MFGEEGLKCARGEIEEKEEEGGGGDEAVFDGDFEK